MENSGGVKMKFLVPAMRLCNIFMIPPTHPSLAVNWQSLFCSPFFKFCWWRLISPGSPLRTMPSPPKKKISPSPPPPPHTVNTQVMKNDPGRPTRSPVHWPLDYWTKPWRWCARGKLTTHVKSSILYGRSYDRTVLSPNFFGLMSYYYYFV